MVVRVLMRGGLRVIFSVAADDPYYCGFTARVPNFVKAGKQKTQANTTDKAQSAPQQAPAQQQQAGREGGRDGGRDGGRGGPKYREPGVLTGAGPSSQSGPNLAHIPQVQPFWWHSRLYPDMTTGEIKLLTINSEIGRD